MNKRVPWTLLAAVAAAGCNTQRFPNPMRASVRPLPSGNVSTETPGPQEVTVFRHSDPVMVRRAGEAAGFPLPFYQKKERVRSGAAVLCAAGGRCEILWPDDASSVVIFDEGVCEIGEPSREEPMVVFKKLTRVRCVLTPEDRVALMGGGILRGDAQETSGPFVIERIRDDVLRVINQSKQTCTIAFRDDELVISPGEYVELPLLASGGAPFLHDPTEESVTVADNTLLVTGSVEELGGGRIRARSDSVVRAMGVTIQLLAGEELSVDVFSPAPVPEAAQDPGD